MVTPFAEFGKGLACSSLFMIIGLVNYVAVDVGVIGWLRMVVAVYAVFGCFDCSSISSIIYWTGIPLFFKFVL